MDITLEECEVMNVSRDEDWDGTLCSWEATTIRAETGISWNDNR